MEVATCDIAHSNLIESHRVIEHNVMLRHQSWVDSAVDTWALVRKINIVATSWLAKLGTPKYQPPVIDEL